MRIILLLASNCCVKNVLWPIYQYIGHLHLRKKNLIILVLVAEPAMGMVVKASNTIFLLMWNKF